jgi:hypothetical protein
MDRTLAVVLAFDRTMRARAATRTVELDHGLVVLHDELPMLHHLNAVLLDAPFDTGRDATAIVRLADAHLAHLPHRHVVLDDAGAGGRLAPQLLDAGWTRDRVVYMQWRGAGGEPPRAGAARELTGPESEALELQILTEGAPGPKAMATALARQLIAGQQAIRAATWSRSFGAFVDGHAVSSATLFVDGEIAIIDEVGTMRAHRERGFARAAIVAALQAAGAAGCGSIVVPADADDWPQLIYAKLGFEPIGRQVSFTRTGR